MGSLIKKLYQFWAASHLCLVKLCDSQALKKSFFVNMAIYKSTISVLNQYLKHMNHYLKQMSIYTSVLVLLQLMVS